MKRRNWIITHSDISLPYKFYGTEEEIEHHINSCIIEDSNNYYYDDTWSNIEKDDSNGKILIYGSVHFENEDIYYTAIPEEDLEIKYAPDINKEEFSEEQEDIDR